MGTFHQDRGEFHGITVVVTTRAGQTWIGRCDTVTTEGVVLLDGDVHDGTEDRDAWVAKAAKVGIWKRYDHALVPAANVASIERLANLRA